MSANNGHANIVPAERGNTRALRHGAYSLRGLSEREAEIVGELEALPWVSEIDAPVLREIASVQALTERVAAALADGRVEDKRGQVRALIDQRRRLSAHLLKLLESIGATPASRASWAAQLARPSFMEEVDRRVREARERNGRD